MPPKRKQQNDYRESESVMNELVKVMQAEEGDTEDEDEFQKELVTWAGRLELESIDLRDKSKSLTSQLVKNSDLLRATHKDLTTWKEKSNDDLKRVIEKLNKTHSVLQKASTAFESRNKRGNAKGPKLDLDDADILSALENLTRQVSRIEKEQLPVLIAKRTRTAQTDNNIAKILKLLQDTNSKQTRNRGGDLQQQSIKALNDNFKDCILKLTTISSDQNLLTRELLEIKKNQRHFKQQLGLINKSIKAFTPRNLLPTLDSSINQNDSSQSLAKDGTQPHMITRSQATYKSRSNRSHLLDTSDKITTFSARHSRKLLSQQADEESPYDDTTLVSLLSDDLPSDL